MAMVVRLAPKNEGLELRDGTSIYRFNARLAKRTWLVEVPGNRLGSMEPWMPTEEQRAAIRAYLSRVKWFGFLSRRYDVEFCSGWR